MGMLLPPAILLDLDDTILEDDAVSERCWERVCSGFAPRIETAGAEKLLPVVQEVRRWFWGDFQRSRRGGRDVTMARREILDISFGRLGIKDDGLRDDLVESFNAAKLVMIEPAPGAMETVRELGRRGIGLGLVTNGSAQGQRAKIERFGLERLFDSIVVEGEFGVGKPDPRVFLHALEQLGVAAEDAWMVGDNLQGDVGGAQGVGIYGVWVDWRGTGLPADSQVQPDRIIRAISELIG